MNHKPTVPVMQTLLPIWQRVLQRSSVRPTDNFFALGGTPSAAAELFSEIAEAFGRDFPAVTICAAPTVETLAALLQEPTAARVPHLLPLRSGSDATPVFISHGLGGTVLDLCDLAGRIESRHTIYGLQARGIDGIDEPLTSIEAMAQYHLDAIRQLQPHGPYFLIGYSLGGLIALEMAHRLAADGEKIALLALVDAYPEKSHLSVAQYVRLAARLATHNAWSLMASPLSRARRIPERAGTNASLGNESDAVRRVMRRMQEADHLAWKGYHPHFYRGRIRFVRAQIKTHFPANPTAVWSHLVEKFEVETLPGDHVGIIATHFAELGSLLSRYLNEAGS